MAMHLKWSHDSKANGETVHVNFLNGLLSSKKQPGAREEERVESLVGMKQLQQGLIHRIFDWGGGDNICLRVRHVVDM